jgi:hypothetical protein
MKPERRSKAVHPFRPISMRAGRRRKGEFGFDSPLWDIIGMIDDPNGPTDVSSDKYKYLTQIYAGELD